MRTSVKLGRDQAWTKSTLKLGPARAARRIVLNWRKSDALKSLKSRNLSTNVDNEDRK